MAVHSVHHAKPVPTQHSCSYFQLQIKSQDFVETLSSNAMHSKPSKEYYDTDILVYAIKI